MAAILAARSMPPSAAAVATAQQASRLVRRAGAGVASTFFSANRRALTAGNYLCVEGSKISSVDRATASFGVSNSIYRKWQNIAAVRDGELRVNDEEMLVLGIETSCDDTGAAVVNTHCFQHLHCY
jgi:hypothetical protein